MIAFPPTPGLRPTPDRVRETVFNWLGQDLSGQRCLDLFAGSGAFGFEAASRGARSVVLVERSRTVVAALRESANRLGAPACRVVHRDAIDFLRASDEIEPFDVVFLDPPYDTGLVAEAIELCGRTMLAGARIYVEGPDASAARPGFRVVKEGRAGAVRFALLERAADETGDLSGNV